MYVVCGIVNRSDICPLLKLMDHIIESLIDQNLVDDVFSMLSETKVNLRSANPSSERGLNDEEELF